MGAEESILLNFLVSRGPIRVLHSLLCLVLKMNQRSQVNSVQWWLSSNQIDECDHHQVGQCLAGWEAAGQLDPLNEFNQSVKWPLYHLCHWHKSYRHLTISAAINNSDCGKFLLKSVLLRDCGGGGDATVASNFITGSTPPWGARWEPHFFTPQLASQPPF